MRRVLAAGLMVAALGSCRERGDYQVYDDPIHGAWREGTGQRLVFFHEAVHQQDPNRLDDSGRGWGRFDGGAEAGAPPPIQWRRNDGVLELGDGTNWERVQDGPGPDGSVVLTWLDGGATATLTPAPYLVIENPSTAPLVEACDAGPPGN